MGSVSPGDRVILDVHARLARSAANGPGLRSVIWTQGCSLRCPGCFNPESHAHGGTPFRVEELVDWVSDNDVDGLTISGGEPLEQAPAVVELARGCRDAGLTVVLLTGFSWKYLLNRRRDVVAQLEETVDVVLAGRYSQGRHLGAGLRGSDNKTVELLSDRYTRDQVDDVPVAEMVINPDGSVVVTGVDPLILERSA